MTLTYFVKGAFEAPVPLRAIVPLAIDYAECNIFVRRPGNEADEAGVLLASCGERLAALPAMLPDYLERRRLGLVYELRVKDVELVSLDDLGWWVVVVVVCLVVLVPLVPHLHTVEVSGLPWAILVSPQGLRGTRHILLGRQDLLVLRDTACDLSIVQGIVGLGKVPALRLRESCSPGRCTFLGR